jgi:hypothetical protein
MGIRHARPLGLAGILIALVAALLQGACSLDSWKDLPHSFDNRLCTHSEVARNPSVMALAHDLDVLEGHIERYGSIVAKQPDVWGQARLSLYRDEFETVMAVEKDTFAPTLQGSLSRSDQTYFADAFALSAAVSGPGAFLRPPARVVVANSTTANAVTPTQIPTPALPDQSDTFSSFSTISRNGVPAPTQLGFATAAGKGGIQLEPSIYLDQKARYLNHLQELRRINEGDDTADSPGYSLNLVRIPVSVLPGKCTEKGHGAEVTMTLTPHLNDELLPTTFRNLVLNDLVDQIGFPVTQFINNPENAVYFDDKSAIDLDALFSLVEEKPKISAMINDCRCTELRFKPSLQKLFARPEWAWMDEAIRSDKKHKNVVTVQGRIYDIAEEKVFLSATRMKKEHEHQFQGAFPVPSTKSRRARMPFPPTELVDVYGYDFTYHLAAETHRTFAKERFSKPCTDSDHLYIHLPDVQGYLQEELAAAQKFLAEQCNFDLWHSCTRELATAIRDHNSPAITALRHSFRSAVQAKMGSTPDPANPDTHSTFAALAWAIIVESALLTDQLVQDMREAAAAKGFPIPQDCWLPYFLPNPPPQTRQLFNEYVRCRWPIHVFALDPVAQQQNLTDEFSSRREMQLAMALAFVNGQISARNMMRYARRLEFDFATIDVNGTSVGFSHSDETFGWRFYPRFQTPDIESNCTICLRDQFIGGPNRDALLKQRRLEPGMRECVAIVVMPSFVPYATLDTSSGWFDLTNPKSRVMDSVDAMNLSRQVKSIELGSPNIADADEYRNGDLELLKRKAKQLSSRLPLQTTKVQVPYENTLGGFAMFNTGVTDLAPELIGWYGSPTINLKSATTLFLVGNHFSVHQSRVIAGGQEVTSRELLSRQVMKVVIPPNAIIVGDKTDQFVDIHLATPYGVTQHLLVPVCGAGQANATGMGWDQDPATFEVAYNYAGLGIAQPTSDPKYRPNTITLKRTSDIPSDYSQMDITLKFSAPYSDVTVSVSGSTLNAKDAYEVQGDKLAKAIFDSFRIKFGPEATKPPVPLTTATISLTFKNAAGVALAGEHSAKPLTVTWVKTSAPANASAAALGAPANP